MTAAHYTRESPGALPLGFENLTVASGIRSAAERESGKTAILCGAQSRTYAQLVEHIDRVANGVKALGLQAGQNAAIVAPNCIEYIEIVAGVSEIGAATATPNPRLTPRELAEICNDAEARILFVHPDCMDSIDRALYTSLSHVIVLGEPYAKWLADASPDFTPGFIPEWTTFAIPYTSGTTGKPKGVMLSHRSRTLCFLSYAGEYGIYAPEDHFLAFAPMCHGAGLAYAMAPVFTGGCVEILSRFDAETVLRAVHSGRVTGMFTVPTHFHAIFKLPAPLLAELRGHRLRGIVANAAPLPQDVKERIVDYFGDGLLHETYGSTEGGVVTNLRPRDQLRKVNCVGQPFGSNLIRLLDDAGREVGPNVVGELFSRSATLFSGYWRKPEATAEAFRDGWVSVGDMARRDDEGYYYIVDRKKDMVITGGMNVYPREVEAVIDQDDAVAESAVIGVPDPQWGEKLVACVVLAPGATLDAAALEARCRAELAPYKLPKHFVAIDALPRNANGKVLKTALRAWCAQQAEAH
ncbi:MAG: AMP-binding protein [Variovorax sp.]|nr:AMP-binding protein [Variovorax sp.]